MSTGEHDTYAERASTLSGENCARCFSIPAELFKVGCEAGCFDADEMEGAWRYCGTCARKIIKTHDLTGPTGVGLVSEDSLTRVWTIR